MKVGDWVYVRPRSEFTERELDERPVYMPEMGQFGGKVFQVSEIGSYIILDIKESWRLWSWNEEWLVKSDGCSWGES